MDIEKKRDLERIAVKIRKESLQAIKTAGSGHVGGSFSIAELLSVLYFHEMHIDPENPKMEDRDRFVLSKGHCAPAVYAALAIKGFFPMEDLATLRRIDSYLSGHIEMKHVPGVDMSAGSLGQGLSAAVGMALSAKTYQKGYRTYCILGDGELQEGQVWEAAMSAGKFKLDNLVAIVDSNKLQLDGTVEEIMSPLPIDKKFESFGWNTITINGHDVTQIAKALGQAREKKGIPTAIIAETTKGKGCSVFENQVRFHGGRPTEAEFHIAFKELDSRRKELEG
ncbi:MAG TPA: transketolase [Clostridiales bacterium]|nr:transketolase [Clostridiales bacterium]